MMIIDQRPPGRHSRVAHVAPTPPPPSDPRVKRGLLAEWRRLARLLDDPAVELDIDAVAPLFACYQRMTAAGFRIDAMAQALVRQLAYQLAASETFLDG